MPARIRHLTASLVLVALTAGLVPFAAPAAPALAAEVGIATVGTADLRALSFVDANTGFAAGADGQIWKTTNGGDTWTSVRNADGYAFRGIDFRDANNGVAVDYDGKVSYTTAGGDSDAEWVDVNFTPYADMDRDQGARSHHDVAWVPSSLYEVFAAAGDPNPSDGVELSAHAMGSGGSMAYWWLNSAQSSPHLQDDGTEEHNLIPVGEAELLDIDFASSTVGWASAIDHYPLDPVDNLVKYPLYKLTYDPGLYSWSLTAQTLGASYSANHYSLDGIAFSGTSAGITVGSLVADSTGRAFYTTNGGTTWTAGTLPGTAALYATDMASTSNGWAVGAGGTIVRTTNGGSTWTACTVPAGFTSALYDVEFIPGTTNGWAVGAAGAALRTTDGTNWTAMSGSGGGGDTTPPTMGAVSSSTHPSDTTWYANNDPAFAWSASDASGIAGYSWVIDASPSTTPNAVQNTTSASVTCTNTADGIRYFHVRAVDTVGNWSAAVHRKVQIDTTAPTGAIFINSGAATTNTRAVTLTFTPSDATSGVIQMRLSNDGTFDTSPEEDWQSYTTPKSWTLTAGDGTKTVYVEFRDRAGLPSGTYFDGITLDTSVPPTVTYLPLEGSDRYGTAAAVSQSTFPSGANAVIVATGLNFPDALASAGLAGAVSAPVLLVHGTEKNLGRDGVAATEIARVLAGKSPRTVFIVGGPSAVSSGIESALKTTYGASNVVRLGGTDRYDTARLVATRMKSEMVSRAMPWTGDAFIVPGLDFRDALIVGPESYARHAPILLYDPRGTGGLSSYCSTLGVTRGLVSGAPSGSVGVVPTTLALPGVSLVRIANAASAPARSTQVASWAFTNLGTSYAYIGIATADLYPDGLSAAPRQGINNGPLLLTPSATLDSTVASALSARDADVVEVRFFGGNVAITPTVRNAVNALLH